MHYSYHFFFLLVPCYVRRRLEWSIVCNSYNEKCWLAHDDNDAFVRLSHTKMFHSFVERRRKLHSCNSCIDLVLQRTSGTVYIFMVLSLTSI